jgi:uncharacterized protein YciI
MFIVLLRFAGDKAKAGQFINAHNAWIQQGFDDEVFLLVGSLQPGLGGVILANDTSQSALRRRIDRDPFVIENVVTVEILEIAPSRVAAPLHALLARA